MGEQLIIAHEEHLIVTAEKLRCEMAGLAAFVHKAEKRLRDNIQLKIAADYKLCRDIKLVGKFEMKAWQMGALHTGTHVCWCDVCISSLADTNLSSSFKDRLEYSASSLPQVDREDALPEIKLEHDDNTRPASPSAVTAPASPPASKTTKNNTQPASPPAFKATKDNTQPASPPTVTAPAASKATKGNTGPASPPAVTAPACSPVSLPAVTTPAYPPASKATKATRDDGKEEDEEVSLRGVEAALDRIMSKNARRYPRMAPSTVFNRPSSSLFSNVFEDAQMME